MRRLLLPALLTATAACHEPRRRECLLLDLAAECPTAADAQPLFDARITWEEQYVVRSGPERWPHSTCDDDDTDDDTGRGACHGPTMSCCYIVEVFGD